MNINQLKQLITQFYDYEITQLASAFLGLNWSLIFKAKTKANTPCGSPEQLLTSHQVACLFSCSPSQPCAGLQFCP